MDFKILGPLEVVGSDGSPCHIPGPKRRSLLALLLVHPNEVLSKDRLMDALWGDDPPSGGHNTLRFHVSKLRAALGADQDRIVTRDPGYGIHVEAGETDADRFETALGEAASIAGDDPEAAAERYREAITMWRGPAFADFEYEDFARTEIARLDELRLAAVESRLEAELAAGRHDDLVGELRSLAADFPLRERIWGALMTALYRSGRQAEALRAYQEARNTLGDELGIEPSPELRDLEEKVLFQDESMRIPERAQKSHNLPAVVSHFVGRGHELTTIRKLLARSRLVTLIGVGGVGKTSLAVEAARHQLDDFEDGIWLIDLATISEPEMVMVALADALGIRTRTPGRIKSDVIARLSDTESLLLVDNCEHLIDTVAWLIAEMLQKCSNMKVLATSRELLGIPGEVMYGVPPMTLPEEDPSSSDAVALFKDRAQAFGMEDLSEDDTVAVGRICSRLDGLPLAIELAAARFRVLSVGELEKRLEDRFALLSGGSRTAPARQRTLRATVDWSYDLLAPEEQWLFGALSQFPGSFTTAAVEAVTTVAANTAGALELLTALVDKSLVVRAGDRYHLLPTLRRYAAERLDSADTALVQDALVTYFAGIARDIEVGLFSQESADQWTEVLGAERAGMRSALAWAIARSDVDGAIALAGALALHWTRAGLWDADQVWLGRSSTAADDAPQTTQLTEGLRLLEDITGPAGALEALARVAHGDGEHLRALRLLGAADGITKERNLDEESTPDLLVVLRTVVAEPDFIGALQEGRALVARQ